MTYKRQLLELTGANTSAELRAWIYVFIGISAAIRAWRSRK